MKKIRCLKYTLLPALAFFLIISSTLAWHTAATCQYPIKDPRSQVYVPVLMYHGITSTADTENTYFISQSLFRSDLDYLASNGYTTVSCQDLIGFVENDQPLPEKPVLITFDDGYANNYLYGYPLLKERNMVALMSIIGKATLEDDAVEYRSEDWCKCSFEELKEMVMSGTFEIGNHTFDLHDNKSLRKGATMIPGEPPQDFADLLRKDITDCQNLIRSNVGVMATSFTWPYGAKDDVAEQVVDSMGFKVTFTCTEGFNTITRGDVNSLKNLKRNLRSPGRDIHDLIDCCKMP